MNWKVSLFLLSFVTLTGCADITTTDDEQLSGMDEQIAALYAAKPECQVKLDELSPLCASSDLATMAIETLDNCDWIEQYRDDFLSSCNDRSMSFRDPYWLGAIAPEGDNNNAQLDTKFDLELQERCNYEKMQNLTTLEFYICTKVLDIDFSNNLSE